MRVKELEDRLEATHIDLAQSKKELNACRISYASMKDDPVVFKFYTGVSVATFDNIKAVLQNAPEGMDYSGTKKGDHDGRGVARTARKLSVDDELLLVLIKLRHKLPRVGPRQSLHGQPAHGVENFLHLGPLPVPCV